MNWDWRITLKGFAMGVADLVPGVSGGTIAFISGIYDALLESLSALSGDGLEHLKRLHWKRAWEAINGPFLMALGLGIIMAIFTLAALCIGCLPMSPYYCDRFSWVSWWPPSRSWKSTFRIGVRIPGCGPWLVAQRRGG